MAWTPITAAGRRFPRNTIEFLGGVGAVDPVCRDQGQIGRLRGVSLRPFQFRTGIAALAAMCSAGLAQHSPVVLHRGAANPTSENWVFVNGPVQGVVSPATNHRGTGVDAWKTTGPGNAYYRRDLGQCYHNAAATHGWTLSARLAVANPGDPDGGVFIEYMRLPQPRRYQLLFSNDGSGNVRMMVRTGIETITGPIVAVPGGAVFHDVRMTFDPVEGSADIVVDGQELFSNYTGFDSFWPGDVRWGTTAGGGEVGAGYFAEVSWSVSPFCAADCDASSCPGTLDVFDFLCFQNRFAAGDPYACDFDTSTGPGVCDIFDFLVFQNAFASGCP